MTAEQKYTPVMTDCFVVGFTGSQNGMTEAQKASVAELLEIFRKSEARKLPFVFGLCVGADDQAAMIAGNLGYFLVARPGDILAKRGSIAPHVCHDPEDNLRRNAKIVGDSSVLIAAPAQARERLRSGTWATIRAARKARVPTWIVDPDGLIKMGYQRD